MEHQLRDLNIKMQTKVQQSADSHNNSEYKIKEIYYENQINK